MREVGVPLPEGLTALLRGPFQLPRRGQALPKALDALTGRSGGGKQGTGWIVLRSGSDRLARQRAALCAQQSPARLDWRGLRVCVARGVSVGAGRAALPNDLLIGTSAHLEAGV